jgi:hypothetical protein
MVMAERLPRDVDESVLSPCRAVRGPREPAKEPNNSARSGAGWPVTGRVVRRKPDDGAASGAVIAAGS